MPNIRNSFRLFLVLTILIAALVWIVAAIYLGEISLRFPRKPLAADHTVSGEDVEHARLAVDNAKAAIAVATRQAEAAQAGVAGVSVSRTVKAIARPVSSFIV